MGEATGTNLSTAQESRSSDEGPAKIVSLVEAFLDMDIASLRRELVDEATVDRFDSLLQEQLGPEGNAQVPRGLVRILAGIKADIYYLKAAYIESMRYDGPKFDVPEARLGAGEPKPDQLTIDMRGDITGRNWYDAESDGRWAGPEKESSVMVPALDSGKYLLGIDVVDEIAGGLLESLQLLFNGSPALFVREGLAFPCRLVAQVLVPADYAHPFWSLKFLFERLVSPAEKGSGDERLLAIRVSSLHFAKMES